MTTEEYWKDRAEQRERKWFNKSETELEKELQVAYSRSLIKIQKETNAMYAKYAQSNGMSLAQAKKFIKGSEHKVWRMDIEEYVKNINSSQDKKLLRELNTLAMRSRISRLDKIYGETLMQLNTLTNYYESKLTKFLSSSFQDNYYHNLYDLNKATGIALPVGKIDPLMIKSILNRPWSGKNYSSRIWNNTSKLAKVVKTEITNGMIRGINSAEMSRVIATKMGGSYSNAVGLVRTELSYINGQAALESIKDAGGEWYRFIATLDKRTSKDCRRLDGKKIEIKDASTGSNMPPIHPRCRSTIAIDFPDLKRIGQRIARDDQGETIHVPANMNYEDWKKVYIDKTITIDDLKTSDKNDIMKVKEWSGLNYSSEYNKKQAVERLRSEYSISFVDSKGYPMNEELLNDCVGWLDSFSKKYAGFMKNNPCKIPELKCLPPSKMKTSVGHYSYYANNPGVVELALNGKYHSDAQLFKKYVDDCVRLKYCPSNATIHETFVHEYGHHVSNSMRWINNDPKWQHNFLKSCFAEYNKQTGSVVSSYLDVADIVSKYAATSEAELFAESFAEYFGGKQPREFALIFGRQLEELLKEVK